MEELSDYAIINILEKLDLATLETLVLTNKRLRNLPWIKEKLKMANAWKEALFNFYDVKIEGGKITIKTPEIKEEEDYNIKQVKKIFKLNPDRVKTYISALIYYINELNNFNFSNEEFINFVNDIEHDQKNWPKRILEWDEKTHKIVMNVNILEEYPLTVFLVYEALDLADSSYQYNLDIVDNPSYPRLPNYMDYLFPA